MKAVAAVLFLAVCAYCGAALGKGLVKDTETVQVCLVCVNESVQAEGVAVRREQLICSGTGQIKQEDGSRLKAGTVLAQNEGGAITVDTSSVFCKSTDGYEFLSPELLHDLTVSSFYGILRCKPQPSSAFDGRLVAGHDWYYAALCAEGSRLSAGDRCELLFDGFEEPVEAGLQYISPAENGKQVLVFRLVRGGDAFMSLRFCKAEILISRHWGLKVPSSAVYSDREGNKFADILLDGLVECRRVDIIYTDPMGQWCLCAAGYQEDMLHEGDSVICPDRGLLPR